MGTFNTWPRRMLCVGAAAAVTLLGVMTGTASASGPVTAPFTECPNIGAAPSCEILLVVNLDQSITVLGDPSVGPYDGGDDTLVGIVNNSSAGITAITVSGPGSDLAGFDGDGICTYATGGYCSSSQTAGTDPGDYAGPGTSFTLDPNSQDHVEVDFAGNGLAAGNSTYFSLEGALTAAVVTAHKGGLNTRYVALGDSVPYGHGLANPYPDSQYDLPATALQQGPSDEAYPVLVAKALHLTLSTRSSNCNLTGDDLTISGAKASKDDVQNGNSQCPNVWTDSQSVQKDELPAAQLAKNPAELVTIQAGADDIRFADCMKWELTKFAAWHAQGTQCLQNNAALNYFGKCFKWEFTQSNAWHVLDPSCVRNSKINLSQVFTNSPNNIPTELANIRTALTDEIKQAAPDAKHIAVLNYYQVIPNPVDFKQSSIFPGGDQVDEACWGLSHNLKGAYNDAVILQAALNNEISGAVSDAKNAGVKNVQLINIADLEGTHEICTGNPALFSGNLMPKSQFYNDIQVISGCLVIHLKSCQTTVPDAKADLGDHTWRVAHPNTFGQQDIARAVENQLGSL